MRSTSQSHCRGLNPQQKQFMVSLKIVKLVRQTMQRKNMWKGERFVKRIKFVMSLMLPSFIGRDWEVENKKHDKNQPCPFIGSQGRHLY